jgi:uncharacterized protein YegL
MPKANYTHIAILLDRSGSMKKIKNDVIGGYNSLISEQKKEPGELTISLVQFDSHYEPVYEKLNIQDVKELTEDIYIPRSMTALNDSMARLIAETSTFVKGLSDENKPERVLFVTATDGEENASKEYTTNALKQLIETQEGNNWEFIYIGANQDSFKESEVRGVKHSMNFTADSGGTKVMYASLSKKMSSYRSSGKLDD